MLPSGISLLHQQPPVINQPSTCLISTYVCFLSIDILTVIILFNSFHSINKWIEWNQLKRKINCFSFVIDWMSEWSWLLTASFIKTNEFVFNYGVFGYRCQPQSTTSLHSLQSIIYSINTKKTSNPLCSYCLNILSSQLTNQTLWVGPRRLMVVEERGAPAKQTQFLQ